MVLAQAVSTKNSLIIDNDFSQKNNNLPNTLTNNLPALITNS